MKSTKKGARRTRQFQIRVSEAELRAMDAAAAVSGLARESWARSALLQAAVMAGTPAKREAMSAELRRAIRLLGMAGGPR